MEIDRRLANASTSRAVMSSSLESTSAVERRGSCAPVPAETLF
jgi:hypothetical protein